MYFFKIIELENQDKSLIHKDEIVDTKSTFIDTLNKKNTNNIHLDVISQISI